MMFAGSRASGKGSRWELSIDLPRETRFDETTNMDFAFSCSIVSVLRRDRALCISSEIYLLVSLAANRRTIWCQAPSPDGIRLSLLALPLEAPSAHLVC